MKTPGPDHPISIDPVPGRIQVRFAGRVVADTERGLLLREAGYEPVLYVPEADAALQHLEPSERRTYCPYKGTAHYFTLRAAGETSENAVWSYEEPFPAVAPIRGCLAFYPDRVDVSREAA